MTIARPPGLRTRRISATARVVFGVWWSTPFEYTRSKRVVVERQRLGVVMDEACR